MAKLESVRDVSSFGSSESSRSFGSLVPFGLFLLAMPLAFVIGLAVHELVHALAVVALGGDVVELRLFPGFVDGQFVLGHVLHDGAAMPALVAAAPTAFWLVVATTATLVARRLKSPRRAWLLTMTLVIAPLLDVSSSFGGLVLGRSVSDHVIAFAHIEPVANVFAALIFVVFATTSRRSLLAWRPGFVSSTTYGVGFGILMLSAWTVHAL